ncbi:MAG: AmmeMemoRadiSam system protein B [Syntrophorhabdaceae bacterium]
MKIIREPSVSGMFYPDDPSVLRKEIGNYLRQADVKPYATAIRAVISPHAGYIYSGQVAAYAYKAISSLEFDTIIVIAPSHRAYFQGIAIWEEGNFRTPLGNIGIDEKNAQNLLNLKSVFVSNRDVHQGEHSLEVQLPFLQYIYKDFKIIPLLMGPADDDLYEKAADGLAQMISSVDERCLIVASTDLSHYYPYELAMKIDGITVDHLTQFDIPGMIRDIRSEKAQACGAGPMITAMLTSRKLGSKASKVLKYANSGDVSGDRSSVVGYVSAIIFENKV